MRNWRNPAPALAEPGACPGGTRRLPWRNSRAAADGRPIGRAADGAPYCFFSEGGAESDESVLYASTKALKIPTFPS